MLEAHALFHIASFLSAHGKSLTDYNLPGSLIFSLSGIPSVVTEIIKENLPADRDLMTDVYKTPREKYGQKAPKLVKVGCTIFSDKILAIECRAEKEL